MPLQRLSPLPLPPHLHATQVTASWWPYRAHRGRGRKGSGWRWRGAARQEGRGHREGACWGVVRHAWPALCSGPAASFDPLSAGAPRWKAGFASQTSSVVSALPLTTTRPSAVIREMPGRVGGQTTSRQKRVAYQASRHGAVQGSAASLPSPPLAATQVTSPLWYAMLCSRCPSSQLCTLQQQQQRRRAGDRRACALSRWPALSGGQPGSTRQAQQS